MLLNRLYAKLAPIPKNPAVVGAAFAGLIAACINCCVAMTPPGTASSTAAAAQELPQGVGVERLDQIAFESFSIAGASRNPEPGRSVLLL
jgi:hypothetical protein